MREVDCLYSSSDLLYKAADCVGEGAGTVALAYSGIDSAC